MKTNKIFIVVLSLAMLLPAFSTIQAQEKKKKEKAYWYVSSYKVPWANIDSLQKLVKKYTIPIIAEAKKRKTLLDYKILIHHTGDEYNVVIMMKYPSWAAIGKGSGLQAAFEAIESNKAKRDSINAAFAWLFDGSVHKDNIYREITDKP
ncbi:MAG: hypothetical protein ABFS35_03770 [Bacteroidota bacterium]